MISFGPQAVDGQKGMRLRKWGLTFSRAAVASAVFVTALAGPMSAAEARDTTSPGLSTVRLADLPVEARRTEQLIRQGGPFPYAKDGVVFGNRERMLPRQRRGWYHEYTVPTPGSRDRGARRIVCGGEQVTEPEACFYTEDHYTSFKRIVK